MSIEYFDKESLQRWFDDRGDETHRLNYDLNENSIVFDVGGYMGDWSNTFYEKFNCFVYIFEPVKKYYDHIVNRFKNNSKIKVFNVAISNMDGESYITHDTASSSIFTLGSYRERVVLKSIESFLKENGMSGVRIDLIKINIEGGEYDLLEEMLRNDTHLQFNDIQIQFHKNIISGYINRRDNIRKALSNTHHITYDYSFVWENWKINSL